MSALLRYDEARNVRLLGELSVQGRVAFALVCCQRLLPAYRRFWERARRGDPDAVEQIAARLWRDLQGDEMPGAELTAALDRCMLAIPREADGWDEETQAYAENASAALAYALRTRLSGEAQEAAWAGARAIESADYFALRVPRGAGPMLFREKRDSTSHPAVQLELFRQERDLGELAAAEREGTLRAGLEFLRARGEREAADFFVQPRVVDGE